VSYLLDLPTRDFPSGAVGPRKGCEVAFPINGDPLEDLDHLRPERWIIALLASILAKSRARENSRPPRKLSCRALAQAHRAVSRPVPPGPAQERLLRNLFASADQLIIDCWQTIERFAQVLAEHGSMTPVEAERTIRELLRTQRATLMAGRR